MNKPLVTVIMSVYNEKQFVQDAIQSILDQTYRNFELIIIDDYSTDRSLEICQSFNDSRIRIHVKKEETRYLAASRNIGVRMAKGEFVTLQDADDVCAPTRLEKQLEKAMENPTKRVVGLSMKRVQDDLERVVVMPERHAEISRGFRRLFNRSAIVGGTILAARSIFEEFPYRERFDYMQDWDQILRMYESGKVEFYNIQAPLYTYYIRPKGVLFNPRWLDCNIFIRNCQARRKKGLEEFETIEAFFEYLHCHPLQSIKWVTLRCLIALRIQLTAKKIFGRCLRWAARPAAKRR